ncbi:MAG: carboxypeptidase regulatory-like domain-containing protein [Thermoanaerobaculia bacterium]
MKGIVTDESGGALPGVTVTATGTTTNLTRATTSDRAGYYSLPPIPAGAYDVSAALAGFSTQVRRGQTFYVGTSINLDFTLKIGPTAETIEVTAEAPILETTKNTLSRLVEKEEIDTLPVVTRNFNDLAALSPGVTRTGVFGGVDISGSRDFQNAYNVDGVSAETHIIGSQRINYSQDWILEFQVLTNQYAAEYGQASGGVLNAITRSGINQWSGRVYGFRRNDSWDSTPEFATRKPPLDEHRLGATLGGSASWTTRAGTCNGARPGRSSATVPL